jgi:serine/threonine-protein kinase RsbW
LDHGSDRGSEGARHADASFLETYPAVAESVAAIRRKVAHFATKAGAPPPAVDAVKLAVSEAVTNVVVHAYADADEPGLIEVEATHAAGELRVSVADTGPGLQASHARPGLGLGLAVIDQLADALPAGTLDSGRA